MPSGANPITAEFPGMTFLRMEDLLPPGDTFLPDKVHPDTAGHLVFGHNLAQALRQSLSASC